MTLGDDGRISVEDLESTNGTSVDGRALDSRPVRLSPGSLVRLGESALRVSVAGDAARPRPLGTAPDGEGHVRVLFAEKPVDAPAQVAATDPEQETRHAYGDSAWGAASDAAQGARGHWCPSRRRTKRRTTRAWALPRAAPRCHAPRASAAGSPGCCAAANATSTTATTWTTSSTRSTSRTCCGPHSA